MNDIKMANREHLFVHRYPGTISADKSVVGNGNVLTRLDLPVSGPVTYWKSPYARDRHSLFNNKSNLTGFIKPQITVTPSKYQHRYKADGNNSAVKGILKHKDNQEGVLDTIIMNDETTTRSSFGKPNLITTGTGSGRPHGISERSMSTDKHVKFDRLPKQGKFWTSGAGSFRGGKKVNVKRHLPTVRQLGSGLVDYRTPYGHSTVVTLSGGESYIKSQIEAFVKKLRLSESAKQANIAAEDEKAQKSTASKLRKTRSLSENRYFHDWKEFDLDKNANTYGHNKVINSENSEDDVHEVQWKDNIQDNAQEEDDELSDRESLTSTTIVFESDPCPSRPARARPMASLNTKYRHITSNDANLHKYDDKYQNFVLGRGNSQHQDVNSGKIDRLAFCDPQKACDIMGWLADVEIAKYDTSPIPKPS